MSPSDRVLLRSVLVLKANEWQALRTQGESRPKNPDLQILFKKLEDLPTLGVAFRRAVSGGHWVVAGPSDGGRGDLATFLGSLEGCLLYSRAPSRRACGTQSLTCPRALLS